MLLRRIPLALGCASALAAVLPAAASAKTLDVVASISVLGDVVKAVGGDHVNVATLVGPNGDPHEYEPAPADARTLKGADLVFVSGLGLEGWMDRLIGASGYAGQPVVASKDVKPREMDAEEAAGHGHEHTAETADAAEPGGHDHGRDEDPHVWNDPKNVEAWVKVIEGALAKADPADAASFEANAAAYTAQLRNLDAYAREKIGRTPEADRKILTSHDALGYFGDAYGVTFLSPLGLSTESEASAQDVAALIDQIRKENVKTYFFENSNDPRLVKQIADATGAEPGGELFVESLSDKDGPAPTYLKMLRYNVDQIAAALNKTN